MTMSNAAMRILHTQVLKHLNMEVTKQVKMDSEVDDEVDSVIDASEMDTLAWIETIKLTKKITSSRTSTSMSSISICDELAGAVSAIVYACKVKNKLKMEEKINE
jgi:hypothetical protein